MKEYWERAMEEKSNARSVLGIPTSPAEEMEQEIEQMSG